MAVAATHAPRRWQGRYAALLAGALLVGLVPAAEARVAEASTVGTAGMGDPYFPLDGNGGIDVRRYAIHDSYDFTERRLSGWTRLTIEATQDLTRFNLDLLLPVQRVEVDGEPAGFEKPNAHELQITPRQPITNRSTFEVLVRYRGRPGAIGWNRERNWLADDGEVVAMNEPHMAPWWFPANNHPRDKALMDIHITAPVDKLVIANGRLVDRTVAGRRATTHWRSAEPMAPYLAFFAAGRFQVDRGTYRGLPWYVAVSKAVPGQTRERSMRLMRRTPRITAWLERRLGDYPFSTTGGLTTSLSPGFALENQTRPTYPVLSSYGVITVVHELAHQWFGDSVSVANWSDIWLNEGAATFMEACWVEKQGGESARHWLNAAYDDLMSQDRFWDLQLDDPGSRHLFDYAVYERGGMALQALRNRIGESGYWELLRTWLATNGGGNGSSEEFEELAAQVSGEDLGGFFQAWLRDSNPPARTAANGLA